MPGVKRWRIAQTLFPCDLRKMELFSHFSFDEKRSTLEPFVSVFFINGRMMLARDLAAFHHERNKRVKL